MIIHDFTKPELDYFRANCNFVNLEVNVFEMRASGIPLEEIADKIGISADYAKKLSQRVNRKILKVI